jgi:hypothetical protein
MINTVLTSSKVMDNSMLTLNHQQRSLLYEYVADARTPKRPLSTQLENLLSEIMSSVNVRVLDTVSSDIDRELIRASFLVMKSWHLLENSLSTSVDAFTAISDIQKRIDKMLQTLPDENSSLSHHGIEQVSDRSIA